MRFWTWSSFGHSKIELKLASNEPFSEKMNQPFQMIDKRKVIPSFVNPKIGLKMASNQPFYEKMSFWNW